MKLNRPNPEKINKTHWEIIQKSGRGTCCICEKKLTGGKYIGKHPETGAELWRHDSCGAGSPNWLNKFNGYLDSDIKKILKGGKYGR